MIKKLTAILKTKTVMIALIFLILLGVTLTLSIDNSEDLPCGTYYTVRFDTGEWAHDNSNTGYETMPTYLSETYAIKEYMKIGNRIHFTVEEGDYIEYSHNNWIEYNEEEQYISTKYVHEIKTVYLDEVCDSWD